MNKKNYDRAIEEIKSFARANGCEISRFSVQDILQMDCPDIREEEIEKGILALNQEGIHVITENDEDYEAADGDVMTFFPANVNIGTINLSITNVMDRLEYDEFDLMPEFQRRGGLWSLEQQSRLIESLMLKIPLPAFYFDASREGNWAVIDGQQRLNSFKNFLVGKEIIDPQTGSKKRIQEKLIGLQYLRDFNGKTFDELPRQYIRRIKETNLIAYTVNKGTPEEIIFNIFRRINTGGINLEPQEIRHALYQGQSTKLIKTMAEEKAFLEATQYKIQSERMLDREYALRFIAFTELDYQTLYKGNIDNYLIAAMKWVNTIGDTEAEWILHSFKRIMKYCTDIFGTLAFRRYTKDKSGKYRRGPINKALFELWSICFSQMSDAQLDIIVDRNTEFIDGFYACMQTNDFLTALKGGDASSLAKRVRLANEFLEAFLND